MIDKPQSPSLTKLRNFLANGARQADGSKSKAASTFPAFLK